MYLQNTDTLVVTQKKYGTLPCLYIILSGKKNIVSLKTKLKRPRSGYCSTQGTLSL